MNDKEKEMHESAQPETWIQAETPLARRVLVVEDDNAMAVGLRDGFRYQGYQVEVARDGVAGLEAALAREPDLVILDVMLPKMTGLHVCKELRRRGSRVPIIMLTARGQEMDKVTGLQVGADDYVTKPFSFMELLARVQAVLRRTRRRGAGEERYTFGRNTVDYKRHQLFRDGEPVPVTAREFRLLTYFIEHREAVVTREQLLQAVWGYEHMPFTRTVDMHVAKLRKKIEDDPHEPRHLVTVHRVGYKFVG